MFGFKGIRWYDHEISRLEGKIADLKAEAKKEQEPKVLHVPVSANAIDVYQARSTEYESLTAYGASYYAGISSCPRPKPEKPKWHGAYFKSCHEAFKVCGSYAEVTQKRALIFEDGSLFILPAKVVPAKFWGEQL